MKTKTFQEIINEVPDLYVDTEAEFDTAFQNAVYDWYRYRRVTSNNRFPLYFQRVLSRDYSRFRQLLRIEAGKIGDSGRPTNYDWLINEYFEEIAEGNEENEVTKANTVSGVKGVGYTETVTHSGVDVQHDETESSSSNSGHSSSNSTITDSTSSQGNNKSGTSTESRAGALSRSNPSKASYTEGNPHTDSNPGNKNSIDYQQNNRGVVYNNNSKFTVGEVSPDNAIYDNGNNLRGYHAGFPELRITNPTTASDSLNTSGSVAENTSTNSSSSTNTSQSSGNNSGSSSSEGEGTSRFTHGHVITTNRSGNAETNNTTTNITEGGTKENTDTVRHSGRHGDIAPMLIDVIKFIDRSSAFDWMRKQLETCFISAFDEEED